MYERKLLTKKEFWVWDLSFLLYEILPKATSKNNIAKHLKLFLRKVKKTRNGS